MSEQKLINANRKIHFCYYDEELDEDIEEEITVDDFLKENIGRRQPTVLTIPDNPTNGTMVMKLFNSYYAETDNEVVKIEIGGKIVEFDLDWWFAPYRMESEE